MLLLLTVLVSLQLAAQPPIPPKSNDLVNDYAGMMTRGEQNQLRNKLTQYALETSTQIAVVTETSLNGETAFDRGLAIAHGWGVGGSAQNDNGIMVYIAKNERRIQILTGYGAEGFLPDILAKRIIENIMKPAFRQSKVYLGIDKATSTIMDLGKGEYTADEVPASGGDGIPPIVIIGLIIVVFILISYYGNRHNDDDDDDGGYWRNGPYDMDDSNQKVRRRRRGGGGFIIFPGFGGGFGGGGGGGGGGFGGGGGGGGGFGGIGGGGFGGGGAGGEW